MPSTPCLIYGANGYTGALIARMAAERGMRPILAGRNRDAIVAQAGALGLEYRVFALDDAAALDVALDGVTVALHCAGPFAHTDRPMVDGCLRKKTHYLDITGEAAVFEALARRDAQAKAAGIMLLPGAGFDVVPSDCLAAHLKRRLPGACRLALAFLTLSRVSWGTATTAVENLHRGGLVRQDGQLVSVPAAHKTRTIDFGDRSAAAVALPWGDVSTAFYSTGIPNIEATARPERRRARARAKPAMGRGGGRCRCALRRAAARAGGLHPHRHDNAGDRPAGAGRGRAGRLSDPRDGLRRRFHPRVPRGDARGRRVGVPSPRPYATG